MLLRRLSFVFGYLALAVASWCPAICRAEGPDFAREVQPILLEHCSHCHGSDEGTRESNLRLDRREDALLGGDSGEAAIVPGDVESSLLWKRISSHDEAEIMPPVDAKLPLSDSQKQILRDWIAAGAPYAAHWAFEPPVQPQVPADAHPVDALVAKTLAAKSLEPSPPAPAEILCRRIYLDLIGLPPTPQQLDRFTAACEADRPAAVAALVDELLASPHYGEKWARHWLDAARYADSNGFEKDLPREQWAWRDWVIAAFNDDMPYDRFVVEQIAGDLLPGATQSQKIATGFLRNSMINEEGAIVPEEFRMEELFNRMDCVGKAVLGLSLQCAQCHTHKFDPLTHDEYYGLFAFLNDTAEAQSWVYTPEQLKTIEKIEQTIAAAEDKLRASRPNWREEVAHWQRELFTSQPRWQTILPVDTGSNSGLNHPTWEADGSVYTLGHPTTQGDIYIDFEPTLDAATGLRLEALCSPDLPFGGPGRSRYGTWAVSELRVQVREQGGDWKSVALADASADWSEEDAPLEEQWKANFDAKNERRRGPVKYLIDGDEKTGWRADRGLGRRNQESVAVVRFAEPLAMPAGGRMRVTMVFNHGASDNGRGCHQIGRCRISLTADPAPSAPAVPYAAVLAMQVPPEHRTATQDRAIFAAWRASLPEAAETNKAVDEAYKGYPAAATSVLHVASRDPTDHRATYLLDRGAWNQPKHEVAPGVPAFLHPIRYEGAAPDRLEFARWLADRESPLTARVAVNRVWQAVFGHGLVATPEDFGTRAEVPVHADLLDYLACDFVERGWSHKQLLRRILTSQTYQQDSAASPERYAADPDNVDLARGPRFRLQAELVRDVALAAAGLLHADRVGGPSIFPPMPESVLKYNFVQPDYWLPPTDATRYRRALYVFRKRSMPDPSLDSFDAPTADFACVRRERSNTPLAALVGLNEPVFVEAAQALGRRIARQGGDEEAKVDFAFRLCTSRPPTPAERETMLAMYRRQLERLRASELKAHDVAFSPLAKLADVPADVTPNELAAWTLLARVLLNLDETITKS